jgi:type IX secretion system PorP/SprF family membrane protein
MFNGLLLNPAYAGAHEALDVTALARKQWVNFNGAPETANLTAHTALKNKKLNLGMVLEKERYGIYSHNKASLSYAYRFPLATGKLSLGAGLGVDVSSYNWNNMQLYHPDDPTFAVNAARSILPDATFGCFYFTKSFYSGFSLQNLIKFPEQGFSSFIFNSGYVISLGENFKFKPAFLMKYLKSSPVYLNGSGTFYFKDIVGLGAGYTINNSYMALIDFKVNEQLNFGYGFQQNLTQLNGYNNGTHELMVRYLFRYQIKAASARYF